MWHIGFKLWHVDLSCFTAPWLASIRKLYHAPESCTLCKDDCQCMRTHANSGLSSCKANQSWKGPCIGLCMALSSRCFRILFAEKPKTDHWQTNASTRKRTQGFHKYNMYRKVFTTSHPSVPHAFDRQTCQFTSITNQKCSTEK